MSDVYVVKGDVIRIPLSEWVYDYFKRVFEWENDRCRAYQETVMYDLNPMYINDYSSSLWGQLNRRLNIDFARELEYRPEFSDRYLEFLVNGFAKDGTFILDVLGDTFSPNTIHYLRGIRLTMDDVNKKFFIMVTGFSSRPTKEEHNANIKAQIRELESRLVN